MSETKNKQDNLRYYELLRKVPPHALKTIAAGRLKGFYDINPVWRIKAMTDVFGPCGVGWKYEIVKQWQETFVHGTFVKETKEGKETKEIKETKAFTNLNLYIKVDGEWSAPIPGTGGATILEINSKGYSYVNDEGYKMSLTDAMGVCMRSLGVAADVYFNKDAQQFDTKYEQQSYVAQQQQKPQAQPAAAPKKPPVTIETIKEWIAKATTMANLEAIFKNTPPELLQQAKPLLTAKKNEILQQKGGEQ